MFVNYVNLLFAALFFLLLLIWNSNELFTNYLDKIINSYVIPGVIYYLIYFIFIYGFMYYSINYIKYKIDNISKFFVIILSTVSSYIFYYMLIAKNYTNLNVTNIDYTILLCYKNNSILQELSINHQQLVSYDNILLILIICYYSLFLLKNWLYSIKELLVDYLDTERYILMKFYNTFTMMLSIQIIMLLSSDFILCIKPKIYIISETIENILIHN